VQVHFHWPSPFLSKFCHIQGHCLQARPYRINLQGARLVSLYTYANYTQRQLWHHTLQTASLITSIPFHTLHSFMLAKAEIISYVAFLYACQSRKHFICCIPLCLPKQKALIPSLSAGHGEKVSQKTVGWGEGKLVHQTLTMVAQLWVLCLPVGYAPLLTSWGSVNGRD